MRLRRETPPDATEIATLLTEAFAGPVEARLVARLRPAGALWLSLLAAQTDRLVGHAALSPVTIGGHGPPSLAFGLAPVAVAPSRQGQGIGTRLVATVLATAREAGAALVVVLGDPAFYARFGFMPAAKQGLSCPWEVPAGVFQALLLRPETPRGAVRYHQAFDSLEV